MSHWPHLRTHARSAARAAVKTAAQLLAPLGLDDCLALGGIAMLGHGVAMVAPWAAWSVCGLIFIWLGVRR